MQEVTKQFEIIHSKVHYPDGSTDTIEHTDMYVREGAIEFHKIEDEDDWSVWCGYKENAELIQDVGDEGRIVIPHSSYKKIEHSRSRELVAVAEVEISKSSWPWKGATIEDVDISIWEKAEWEAQC